MRPVGMVLHLNAFYDTLMPCLYLLTEHQVTWAIEFTKTNQDLTQHLIQGATRFILPDSSGSCVCQYCKHAITPQSAWGR